MRNRWFHLPSGPPEDPPPGPPDFLPEGMYLLEAERIEEKVSRFNNEYYNLTCKVLNGSVHRDFRIHFVLSTTLPALWRLGEFIEAIRGERPVGEFLFAPGDYLGIPFQAELRVSKFRDKWRNEVGSLYFFN